MSEPARPLDLAWLVRLAVPLHVALPVLGWLAAGVSPTLTLWTWVGIHLLFPVLLVLTWRRWWDQMDQVVMLLVLDHVVSFVTLAVLDALG